MTVYEVEIPGELVLSGLEPEIEAACQHVGLNLTLKGTQSRYPGSVHWHYKQGKLPGTLEITLWYPQKRLWLSVQEGRRADWLPTMCALLREKLENRFRMIANIEQAKTK
jgi:hypothetical protein